MRITQVLTIGTLIAVLCVPVPAQSGWGAGVCTSVEVPVVSSKRPTGVNTRKLEESRKSGPKYRYKGKPTTRGEVRRALDIKDISKRKRITVVSDDPAERAKALEEIGDQPDAVINAFPKNAWQVKHHKSDAKTSVWVQDPDGRVVHKQDGLSGLRDAIALAMNPDLRQPVGGSFGWGIVLGAGGAFLLFLAFKMLPKLMPKLPFITREELIAILKEVQGGKAV